MNHQTLSLGQLRDALKANWTVRRIHLVSTSAY